ncbi:MAG: hypothetical protein WCJ35_21520 [Planctomycetota bacterium]
MVVIIIISILAGALLGALGKTREAARLAATKATVKKLNELVTRKYESYAYRRVPLSASGMTTAARKGIIDYLKQVEMPKQWTDVSPVPTNTNIKQSAMSRLYKAKYDAYQTKNNKAPSTVNEQAKCLYLWVMTSIPEAKPMFNGSEIATDGDGWKMFIDGWGNPIGLVADGDGWKFVVVGFPNGFPL